MAGITRAYQGWRVLAGTFLCAMLVVGFTTYIFGLFVIPLGQEFGISRADANNAMIAFLLGTGLLSVAVGPLLDRAPVRLVMICGALLFGVALATISRTDSLPLMLAMVAGPLAFANASCGALAANTVVVRWFGRRRGKALGVLAASTSTGGFIAVPITALLIESLGWRAALLSVGVAVTAAMILLALLLVRDRPTSATPGSGAELRGGPAPLRPHAAEDEVSWSHRSLLVDRNFWLLTLGIGLLFSSDQAILASQVPYFQDSGLSISQAAVIASVMTASAIGGKFVVGYLADKMDLRLIYHAIAAAHLGLLAVYILQPGYWALVATAATLGIAVGGVMPVWTTIMAWLFGSRSYGTVMGLITLLIKPLSFASLRFVGEVHDRLGTYQPAFMVFALLVLLSMVMISQLRTNPTSATRAMGPSGTRPAPL